MSHNVELTGRGTGSLKINPYFNRAPVERNVRPNALLQDLTPPPKTKWLRDVESGDILSSITFVHSPFSNDAVRASPHPTALHRRDALSFPGATL